MQKSVGQEEIKHKFKDKRLVLFMIFGIYLSNRKYISGYVAGVKVTDYPTAVCFREFGQKIVRAYPGEEGKDQLLHQLLYNCSRRSGFKVFSFSDLIDYSVLPSGFISVFCFYL